MPGARGTVGTPPGQGDPPETVETLGEGGDPVMGVGKAGTWNLEEALGVPVGTGDLPQEKGEPPQASGDPFEEWGPPGGEGIHQALGSCNGGTWGHRDIKDHVG